jgi:ABC-2 type transport system permease protein
MLIVTLLTFLGGSLYAIDMLPLLWWTNTLVNPVVYLISGFRWRFFNTRMSASASASGRS